MRPLCLVVCLFLALPFARAQSDRGVITGTVADQTGAVISGAAIEAKNTGNGAVYRAGSSATGNYTLGELPTGNYELTVQMPRFKTFEQRNIFLPVAQTVRIDAVLEIGPITESVTVSDQPSLLKTETGGVSHNIQTDTVNNIPALPVGTGNGARNPLAITRLLPGSSYQADMTVRINGIPANTQSVRLDGQEVQTGIASVYQSWTQPSMDAIQEVAVQTSTYAAEFGQAGGGVFNATMRSGTNQYHGSVYDYMKNEALNAGRPNTFKPGKPDEHQRPIQRQHDYGFTFGGPIAIPKLYDGHNRSFIFFSFEQFRESLGSPAIPKTVPTLEYREGNFQRALGVMPIGMDKAGRPILQNQIFDPNSDDLVQAPPPSGLCLNCTGQLERVRDPFPNNRVPVSYFDPVALAVQSYMPLPDNNLLINNYMPSYVNSRTQTLPSFKIDQNLTDTMKLSGYYGLTSGQNSNLDGLPYPITSTRGMDIVNQTIRLNFDYTLSPTVLLHLGAGLTHTLNVDKVREFDITTLGNDGKGLQGTGGGPFMYSTFGSNMWNPQGGYSQAIGPQQRSSLTEQKPAGSASLSWVRSNHTMKFGGEFIADAFFNESYSNTSPLINFSANNVTTPSVNGAMLLGTSGFPYASFLMGRADNGETAVPNTSRMGKHSLAFYAQDTWKVTRKLTLDYGLRYDFQTYLREHSGYQPNLGPTTPNPIADNRLGGIIFEGYSPGKCQCNFARNYPWAFGPRLGASYQLNSKTVVRGGFGVSYTRTSANNLQSYAFNGSMRYSAPQFGDPAYLLKDGLPYQVTFPNLDPGQYPYQGIPAPMTTFIDQNAGRPGRLFQWNLMVQREIVRDLVVEAGYVGNRGAWFQSGNAVCDLCLQPQELAKVGLDVTNPADQIVLRSPLNSAAAAQAGFSNPPYSRFPLGSSVKDALTPFPMYNLMIQRIGAPLGTTWFDSLQANVTKRFSHGLELQTNFTWSRQFANGVESESPVLQAVAPPINDVFNREQNKYLSGFDQPFQFVIWGSYTTPRWTANRWVGLLTGGWQLSVVMRYTAGTPIRVPSANNNNPSLLNRATFANIDPTKNPFFLKDPNCKCFDPSAEPILDRTAWINPAPGTFGTSAAYYTNYRNPRRPDENVGFARNFRFGEGRMNLQIRAEFSNIFNRWTWPAPNSTSPFFMPNTGQIAGVFGYVDIANGQGAIPRSGTLVGRFTF